MKAAKTVFLCSNCGNETPRWQGRCPSCGQWNTFREIQLGTAKNGKQAYRSSHEAKTAAMTAVNMKWIIFIAIISLGLVS